MRIGIELNGVLRDTLKKYNKSTKNGILKILSKKKVKMNLNIKQSPI